MKEEQSRGVLSFAGCEDREPMCSVMSSESPSSLNSQPLLSASREGVST